jgi:hypothetical protein
MAWAGGGDKAWVSRPPPAVAEVMIDNGSKGVTGGIHAGQFSNFDLANTFVYGVGSAISLKMLDGGGLGWKQKSLRANGGLD